MIPLVPVYGVKRARITLYDGNGNATQRFVLQAEQNEGLELSFPPEGNMHQLGSGAGWAKVWGHRGFRPVLGIKWAVARQSMVQAASGSGWGDPIAVDTAQALGLIISSAMLIPCKVEPHHDINFSFLAQPDPGKAFVLSDLKRLVHRGLRLDLVSSRIIPAVPDWSAVNNYFAPGYIAAGYLGWTL